MKIVGLSAIAVLALTAPVVEASQLGQASTPSGSAFASVCAGYSIFSGLGDPGLGYNYQGGGASGTGYNCANNTSSTGASVQAALAGSYPVSILNQSFPYDSSATSSATLGSIHLQSSNASEPIVDFPGAAGNGGWNDTVTLTGGSGTGIWVFPLNVSGSLSAVGGGSRAIFEVGAYQALSPIGGDYVPGHPAIYDTALNLFNSINVTHNGTVGSSWDFEMSAFEVSGTLTGMTVNEAVQFAVPFTYGTPFELGIYASDLSAETGFGFDPTANTSSADFAHTVTWGGPGYVIGSGNQTTTNFGITSGSGFDYTSAVVPEPALWGPVAGVLILVLWKLRYRKSISG